MNRRWERWIPVVLIAAAIAWWGWSQNRLSSRVAAVERDIAASVRAGSTRDQVEAWLDSRHLDKTFLPAGPRMDGIGFDNVTERAGLDHQRLSGCLRAEIGSSGFGSSGTRVYAYFFFDKKQRLVKTSTEWYAEGEEIPMPGVRHKN